MKQIMRLTESDIHRIVNESVKRILSEDAGNEYRGVFLPPGCNTTRWRRKIDICLDEKWWSVDKVQNAIDDFFKDDIF